MKKLFLRNIKKGFATNSSSYHSMLILNEEEYEKWTDTSKPFEKDGYLNGYKGDNLVHSDYEWLLDGEHVRKWVDEADEWSTDNYESETYETSSGEMLHILCKYGRD